MAGLNSSELEAIIKLANKGMAGRELRKALADDHNIILGRNQIGGLLYRLRQKKLVKVPAEKIRATRQRNPRSSVTLPKSAGRLSGMPMLQRPRFAPPPQPMQEAAPLFLPTTPPLPETNVVYGPANLFELRRDSCRWPLWGDHAQPITEKLFCNEAQFGEGPYCCAHMRASTNRMDHPPSIRNAANGKKSFD